MEMLLATKTAEVNKCYTNLFNAHTVLLLNNNDE